MEKVEAVYKKCPLVEQIWVYGNSFESVLVAVRASYPRGFLLQPHPVSEPNGFEQVTAPALARMQTYRATCCSVDSCDCVPRAACSPEAVSAS